MKWNENNNYGHFEKLNCERGKIGCVVEGSMVLKEGIQGCLF